VNVSTTVSTRTVLPLLRPFFVRIRILFRAEDGVQVKAVILQPLSQGSFDAGAV
jgi:hypothetical protein